MNKLIVFTGSGISVESGVPTYRADKGLWNEYDLDKVCNANTWLDNYELVHEFYNRRREELGTVVPNKTHDIITSWQRDYDTVLITQNVDDLHERSGASDVIHIHGELTKIHCIDPACQHKWDIGYTKVNTSTIQCPKCGNNKVKPSVVFFNEAAPRYSDLDNIIADIDHTDTIVVMGTSGTVVPIDMYIMNKPGLKILNNLSEGTMIGEREELTHIKVWDHIIYKTSSQGAEEISEILRSRS